MVIANEMTDHRQSRIQFYSFESNSFHIDDILMNKSLAAHYLTLSADQGIADAQLKYGFMLCQGDGISMHKSLAAHYSKLSADQGIAAAQFNDGVMLFQGDDISMNKSLATHYFKADDGMEILSPLSERSAIEPEESICINPTLSHPANPTKQHSIISPSDVHPSVLTTISPFARFQMQREVQCFPQAAFREPRFLGNVSILKDQDALLIAEC
jgi:hypothetical protein